MLIRENAVDMVMTAHIFNKTIDPELPATLSPAAITGILREELGYSGVVITDDLQMGAISRHFSLEQAILHAVNAGNDILLFSGYFEPSAALGERVHALLMNHIRQGRISEERIRLSFQRIQALRLRLFLSPANLLPRWLR